MGCCVSIIDVSVEDFFLRNATKESTRIFTPDLTRCKVIDVYDGDTITIAARLSKRGKIFAFKVRIRGIDCAEMRGKGPAEKEQAIKARDALRDKIGGRYVTLRDVAYDKYGRVLAEVWRHRSSVGAWMIEQRLAVPYDGRGEQKWSRVTA